MMDDSHRLSRAWLTALIAAVLLLSTFDTADRMAEQRHQALFERALVTFALARALNGLISTVQGTELALQPAGVGVTLTPGEILDPVNDLVERFSWIMLAATLSLGVQQLLLDMGQWWGTRLLVLLAGLAVIAFSWQRDPSGGGHARLASVLPKLFLVLLLLRFTVPVAMIVNESVYGLFLETRYQQSSELIERAGADLEQLAAAEDEAKTGDESLIASLGRVAENARASMDIKARLADVGDRASEVIEQLLQLAAVFVFQTILLPVLFIWLFLKGVRCALAIKY